MPLPNIHTARQMSPDSCASIRQESDKLGPGITVLWCVRPGKPVAIESLHFDAAKFTAEEAKAWLAKHDFKSDRFEPATKVRAAIKPDLTCDMVNPADCPMGDKCPMRKGSAYSSTAAESGVLDVRCGYGGDGAFEIEAQAAGNAGGLPRVHMLAYTGVPMKLEGFHLPVVVDLDTLKVPRQKVPLLRDHESKRIAGHSESIDVTQQRLKVAGVLSGMPEHTTDIVQTAGRGFPWQVSIGAQSLRRMEHIPAGESVKVNGRNWPGPLLVARGAVLREVSILPMGADGNTDAGLTPGAE